MKWKRPKIKHNKLTKWNWMVSHPNLLKMGKNVDIGAFTYIQAEHGVVIRDNVQIGGGCHIYSKDTISGKTGCVVIGEGCKIGAHCVILPGVVIKRGTLIKAGSILKRGIYE